MRALLALLLAGCLGPELILPPAPPSGAHDAACAWKACPRAAAEVGGIVDHSRYNRALHTCDCFLLDANRVPVWLRRDPHKR